MKELAALARQNPQWGLEEFVEVLNRYLPDYIYPDPSDARLKPRVNQRLVRYYKTQGMLDEPLKAGRNAVYTYRHLLQALAVRRLLSEGYGSGVIGKLAREKSNKELEDLLQGGFDVNISVANPALTYLDQIKERERERTSPSSPSTATQTLPENRAEISKTTVWRRVEVMPGLELNIRDDMTEPRSEHEKENLTKLIYDALRRLF